MDSLYERTSQENLGEETFQLVWHNYQSNFHEVVGDLLGSEAFSDVSLVAEGRLMRAHRLVLSACSPYLHGVLAELPPAPAHPVLLLPPEVSQATLRALLLFMYRGVVDVPQHALVAVLHAGEILQVRGLCRGDGDVSPPSIPEDTRSHHSQQSLQSLSSEDSGRKRRRGSVSGAAGYAENRGGMEHHKTRSESQSQQQQGYMASGRVMAERLCATVQGLHLSQSESPDIRSNFSDVIPVNQIKEEPYDWSTQKDTESPGTSTQVTSGDEYRLTLIPDQMPNKEDPDDETGVNDGEGLTPLTCEQCHQVFPRAGAWVRHLKIHPPVSVAREDPRAEREQVLALLAPAMGLSSPAMILSGPSAPSPTAASSSSTSAVTGKTISRSSTNTLSLHHHHRRPHFCNHCGKKFSSRASLSIHCRTHTGEQPFICNFCTKGFNVKSNLLRHLRTLHNKIISPSEVVELL